MQPEATRTLDLDGISRRRFHDFSEAVDELLEALAEALPGVVALTRRDPDERVHRVIEARGEGVSGLISGVAIPQAGSDVDAEFLRPLGARDCLAAPLEMSDGRIVGLLCAADERAGVYREEHAAQLSVAARLLAYEWENVELRSELRRLRSRFSASSGGDADTGFPDREGFLELLAREWRLAERGAVQSVLIACRVAVTGGVAADRTSAKEALALKLAAETLKATTRDTDPVGRIAEDVVGTILVGCDTHHTPSFVARFLGALERVTEGGRAEIEVSCGVQPLAGTASPEEALELAEIAAGEAQPAASLDPDPRFSDGRARPV
jgi:GGDEF domain-containing protein